uniref:Autophagy-related protein 101 n=1 Tax=Haemonchus placei TaxID=6290 RepID=A0A0N4VST6_HAEPC
LRFLLLSQCSESLHECPPAGVPSGSLYSIFFNNKLLSGSPRVFPNGNGSDCCFFQSLEIRQVNDAVSCIFHSLLAHRSVAKFQYKGDSNYSLGSLGIKEVECENIDLTYVSVLHASILFSFVVLCCDLVMNCARCFLIFPIISVPLLGAQISLEFFQRRPRPWPLPVEAVAWERWILFLDIFKANSYDDLARMRVSVAESVGEIVLQLCSSINRPQYLPKMPTRTELSNVFDSNLSDCQPYLFKVCRVPIRPGWCDVYSGNFR